jgi:hypothetical protein
MGGCFAWLLFIAGAVFVLASMLRWFEATGDALDAREWNKLTLLIVFPFSVWLFPSRVAAGRPTAVPHHEPARGFGKVPPMPSDNQAPVPTDQPPPGTPSEFLGMPKLPPKKPRAPIDPEKLAKLRQKMKDQGMLDE